MQSCCSLSTQQAIAAMQPGHDPYAGHSDTGGFFSSISHAVSKAAHAVTHPEQTVKSAIHDITHPLATVKSLGKSVVNTVNPINIAKGAMDDTRVLGKGAVIAAKASYQAGKWAGKNVVVPAVQKGLPIVQTVLKNAGPIGMVASGALSAMKAGLSGKNLEDIAWAAAEGAAPSGIDKAIQAAEAIRHGQNIVGAALNAGVTHFIPGSPEHLGFDTAVGVLKQTASKAALGVARRALPTEGSRRAFDAAIGVASQAVTGTSLQQRAMGIPTMNLSKARSLVTAGNPQIMHVMAALKNNPGLMTQDANLLAKRFGTHVSAINDAMNRSGKIAMLPWRSMSPHAVNFIRRYAPQSPLMALRHLHTDTAGLDQTGMKYIVEKGDGPWAIAQKLTGNGNRWTELKAVNQDKNPKVEKNVWVGEVLNLPLSWQKPAAVAKPPTSALPSVPLPSIGPVPSTAVPVLATPSIDITPSIIQGKSILVAWSKTDGINQAGLPDYGLNVADLSTSMGPRDTLELASFQNWNNKTLGGSLNTTGALDPATLTALQSWAEARATSTLPGGVTAGGAAPPIPVGTASFPPVVIPEVTIGGTAPPAPPPGIPALPSGASPLPTVAPANAPTTPTKVAAQKQGGGLAPIAMGAVVGGLLFGVPGALVGAAGGAAIS